ncbi:MAG: hypothetical protein ACTSP4_16535 [Candidatus Hodarchaeales archaeon]
MISQTDIDEAISLIVKLVQNKCINPPGTELVSIKTIEDYIKARNVPSKFMNQPLGVVTL